MINIKIKAQYSKGSTVVQWLMPYRKKVLGSNVSSSHNSVT